jgi:hypothetical protein
MTSSLCRRALALFLAATTALLFVPAPALAAGEAEFAGRVFDADGATPRPGVVVTLFDAVSEETVSSEPTNDEGTFRIEQAPAGTYQLVAETSEGAFLAEVPVELQPGANRPLSLTLKVAPAMEGTTGSKMKTWKKGLIAGAIAVSALFLINEVTDEADASSPRP